MLQYFKLFLQIAFAIVIPFIVLEEIQTRFFPGILEVESAVIGGIIGIVLSLMVADRFVIHHEKKSTRQTDVQ